MIQARLTLVFIFMSICKISYGDDLVATVRKTNRVYNRPRCPLDPMGLYPYLVKVFDKKISAVLRHGVILSHRAVLTTGYGFAYVNVQRDLVTVGQRIFRMRGENHDICYQVVPARRFIRHPSCRLRFFNFGIIELAHQFESSPNFVFPVVPLHKNPYELMQFIRTVNVLPRDTEGCELPRFSGKKDMYPVFEYTAKADSRKFETECISAICQSKDFKSHCVQVEKLRTNSTMLCVRPKWTKTMYEEQVINLHGAPLVCNNSAIALMAGVVGRRNFGQDWIFLLTYLRAWPFIIENKKAYWNSTYYRRADDDWAIEKHRLRYRGIPERRFNKDTWAHHGFDKKKKSSASLPQYLLAFYVSFFHVVSLILYL